MSSKRSINYKTLRGMLKYYKLYEENDRDIEETSIAYLKWSRAWNEKVRTKKWKRPPVYEPPFLTRLVDEIEDKRTRHEGRMKNTREYDDLRNQARRFLRKGEVVMQNVGRGEFPGEF